MQVVKIVSGPDSARTTLLDLSPGSASGLQLGSGFDAPPPPLQRTIVNNPVKDGATIPQTSYGLRTVKLPVAVPTTIGTTGASIAARQTAITTLIRLLDKERFWLEVAPDGAASSRFLKCYRASDASVVAALRSTSFAEATVTILADPFAYGALELLGALPTAESNSLAVEVTNVKGDVPCPLIVKWNAQTSYLTRPTLIMGSRSDPSSHAPLVAADTVLASSFASTAGVADTNALGGTVRRIDFTTAGQSSMLSGVVFSSRAGAGAGASSNFWRGTYRAFLAVSQGGVNGNTHTIQMYGGSSATPVARGAPITVTRTGAGLKLVDLGLIDYPGGGQQATAPLTDAPMSPQPSNLLIGVTSNQGATLSYDALILVPASEALLILDSGIETTSTAQFYVVDPYSGGILMTTTGLPQDPGSGNIVNTQRVQPSYVGDLPKLSPGSAINTIVAFVVDGSSGQYGWVAGDKESLNATNFYGMYYPQYLTVV